VASSSSVGDMDGDRRTAEVSILMNPSSGISFTTVNVDPPGWPAGLGKARTLAHDQWKMSTGRLRNSAKAAVTRAGSSSPDDGHLDGAVDPAIGVAAFNVGRPERVIELDLRGDDPRQPVEGPPEPIRRRLIGCPGRHRRRRTLFCLGRPRHDRHQQQQNVRQREDRYDHDRDDNRRQQRRENPPSEPRKNLRSARTRTLRRTHTTSTSAVRVTSDDRGCAAEVGAPAQNGQVDLEPHGGGSNDR
jgi:hypothetical protein